MPLKNAYNSFYLHPTVYYLGLGIAILFAASFLWPLLFTLALLLLLFFVLLLLTDAWLLYSKRLGISAQRQLPDRLSNGDENKVYIMLQNHYLFAISTAIIEELPFQLQQRHWLRKVNLKSGEKGLVEYTIRPVQRGLYDFGHVNIFVSSPLKLVQRRYRLATQKEVKVYPSIVQMRQFELMAISNNLSQKGNRKVRRLGHSMEFELIKEYVRGDDYRTINWKATARSGHLMLNSYADERSQAVYCLVNKSRLMKMPFEDMTLLDYAINAAIVLSNTALSKGDRAGLITFADTVDTIIKADNKRPQMSTLLEALYAQQTNFAEADWEALYSVVRQQITQRSLLVLFTNFQTVESLQQNLPFLKQLAHYHLLLVVFFENTELLKVANGSAENIEEIYVKTIAQKFIYEKKQMVRLLQQHGIIALLTAPKDLTMNTVNKYLELKNRQSI